MDAVRSEVGAKTPTDDEDEDAEPATAPAATVKLGTNAAWISELATSRAQVTVLCHRFVKLHLSLL